MLVVDLDGADRCHNPGCRAAIEPPGEPYRYCPRCGTAQVFECEACPSRPGALLRVAHDSACPDCGALYVLCAGCHCPILVRTAEPMECPQGCGAGVVSARTGVHEPLANPQRTGAVVSRAAPRASAARSSFSLGEPTGPAAARYGRLYFVSSRGTILAVDEDTLRPRTAWEQPGLFTPDPTTLRFVSPQVSERYVYFHDGAMLHACSVVDGARCFSLEFPHGQTHCVIADDRLLLCGLSAEGALVVELHDTLALCADDISLLRREELRCARPLRRQPPAPVAVTADAFLLRDLDGSLRRLPCSGKEESSVVWENALYGYVSAPAVMGQYAYLLLHSQQEGTSVLLLSLVDQASERRRLPDIPPSYGVGLRLLAGKLYLHDAHSSYYEIDLASPSSPPSQLFMGERLVGDMVIAALFAIQDAARTGAWLVSLAGSPDSLKARLLHAPTREFLQLDVPPRPELALAASDRHVFVTDTKAGETFVYDIPTPQKQG